MQKNIYSFSRWACFAVTVPRMSTMLKKYFDLYWKSTDFYQKYREETFGKFPRQKQNGYNELVVFKLRSLALMDQLF